MATIRLNGRDEVLAVRTIAELVAEKSESPEGRGLAVALNGALVRRAQWSVTALKAGDEVEIVRAMQGG